MTPLISQQFAPPGAALEPLKLPKGRAEAKREEADVNPRPADAGADVAWAGQGTRDGS